MKKTIVALTTGLLLVGTATSQASAAEYQVNTGDTLWGIAQESEVTVDYLKTTNDLAKDTILPGQLLQIDNEIVHTVKVGDTLSELAEEYQVSVEGIKSWNELTSDLILIDQELVMKDVKQAANDSQVVSEEPAKVKTESVDNNVTDKKEEVQEVSANSADQQETITVSATAYTADCNGCSGVTATGIDLNNDRNKKVIAVDPNVIPLGTKVYVEGYGEAIAGDTGGAIKGNKIDIHVPTKDEAYQWGVRTVDVTILK